jgi:hypothetical protein
VVYIGIINYGKWQQERHRKAAGDGMSRFFALSSVLLCGLSAVAMLWTAFPIFILPACAA